MIVQQLIIYPIKGLKGMNVTQAMALEKGFKNDRRYMLVDPEGKFLSQRNNSQMALFETSIQDEKLLVKYKEEQFELDITQSEGERMHTTVWEHSINAIQVNKKADEWFSDQIGQACKLVKMTDNIDRKKILKKDPGQIQVSFADGYPYLILGTESLDHLNGKLESKIDIDRFRANIIVKSSVAHEEDELDHFTINGVKFRGIKPCARCQVITIDQKLATKSAEPLKTLASYRQVDNKIYFGNNVICLEEGIVSVGDKIEKL